MDSSKPDPVYSYFSSPAEGKSESVDGSEGEPLQLTTGSKRKDNDTHDGKRKRFRSYGPCIEDWQAAAMQYESTLPTYHGPSTSFARSAPKYPSPTSTYPNPESTYRNIEYPTQSDDYSNPVAGPSYMTAGSARPADEPAGRSPEVPPEPYREYHGTKTRRFKSRWLRSRPDDPFDDSVFLPIASTSQQSAMSINVGTQVDSSDLRSDRRDQHNGGHDCVMCRATKYCRRNCLRNGSRSHKPCCLHGMELGSSTDSPYTERTHYHHDRLSDYESFMPMAQDFTVTPENVGVPHYSGATHESPMLYEDPPE